MRSWKPTVVTAYGTVLLALLVLGARRLTPTSATLCVVALAGVVSGVASYKREWRWAHRSVGVFLATVLTLGVALLVVRLAFVLREGGMERADGYGSPLSFLIGLALEQGLLTAPAGLLLVATRDRLRSVSRESVEPSRGE
jgi:ABC-type Co2+ transport system permease subunit